MKAVIRYVINRADLGRSRISRALARADIEAAAPQPEAPNLPVLFFFDDYSPQLLSDVRISSRHGLSPVLAIATSSSVLRKEDAWRLLGAGASDVFAWDHWVRPADEIAAKLARWTEVDDLVFSPAVQAALVGQGVAWLTLLRQIVEVARFTNASVLITGESGTGKELVARLIHALDARPAKRTLVVLDCTTVVPTLSGSEFFGHERGAFTGAVSTRDGAFAQADGGTLFLDEVGDLPLPLQAEVLRVIQEGTFKRVGSDVWRQTSFRLVCATNRDLLEEQDAGRFRRDLFYRIAEWQFHMPPLRERLADVPLLTRAFLQQAHPDGDRLVLDPTVRELIASREYPGNVRDLRQFVFRISKRHVGPGPITAGDVPPDERGAPPQEDADGDWWDNGFVDSIHAALAAQLSLREISRRAAETAIELALADAGGSLQQAAKRLGVTPRALQLRRASRKPPVSASEAPEVS